MKNNEINLLYNWGIANQLTGFYMMGTLVIKRLTRQHRYPRKDKTNLNKDVIKNFLHHFALLLRSNSYNSQEGENIKYCQGYFDNSPISD